MHETHADAMHEPSDGLAMFRVWTLLTGAETMRGLTVTDRKIIQHNIAAPRRQTWRIGAGR